jgi:acetylornithine deacetylase
MNTPRGLQLSDATSTMIRRLVAFDTTSRKSNLELIDWVRDYLGTHGIDSRLTFDDSGKKANLFATIGPAIDGGIVLSGHTDVVPVDGQSWSSDPWSVVATGEHLVGRGVCDMKSFIAVALALVPDVNSRTLHRPLHLALSYDEEVGCIGVRQLISDLANLEYKPGGCIVGEPTGMELVVAHKGKRSYRCRVRGFECHSALTPNGVNAVEIAAELVAHLRQMGLRFREQGRFDRDYDVPFTTVHVGTIHGGTALNIVPKDCEFVFEFRFLPFDDPVALLAEIESVANALVPSMHAVHPDTGIAFEQMSELPGFDTGAGSAIAELGRHCNHGTLTNKVSFGAEAALFHNAGIPTILCGPGHIAQAHQPDEWISVDQVVRCERFMHTLVERLSMPSA